MKIRKTASIKITALFNSANGAVQPDGSTINSKLIELLVNCTVLNMYNYYKSYFI